MNKNKPAFPTPKHGTTTEGLTAREYIAASVLSGLLSSGTTGSHEAFAIEAVRFTDALLLELNK